jgi:hypothetical protein
VADDGWYPDPNGRFEYRWMANDEWTDTVSNGGDAQTDSFVVASTAVDPPTLTSGFGEPDPTPFGAPPQQAFGSAAPPAAVPSWGPAPAAVTSQNLPAQQRLRTGVPGPVAWAAAFLSTTGVLMFGYGILAVFLAAVINDVNNDIGGSDFGDDATSSVAGVGVFMLVVGGFYLLVAISIMMLIPWSRVAGIVLGSLHALASLLALSQSTGTGVILLIISAVQIWLLCTPTAVQAFKTRAVGLNEVAQPLRT